LNKEKVRTWVQTNTWLQLGGTFLHYWERLHQMTVRLIIESHRLSGNRNYRERARSKCWSYHTATIVWRSILWTVCRGPIVWSWVRWIWQCYKLLKGTIKPSATLMKIYIKYKEINTQSTLDRWLNFIDVMWNA
jgi:hypothetical protein